MFQIILFIVCPIFGFIGYGFFVMVRSLVRDWKIKKALEAGLCTKCSTPNSEGASFCMKCGMSLSRDPALTKTHIDEVLSTLGAIIFTFLGAAALSVFTRLGNKGYFIIGISPVLFLAGRFYVAADKWSKRYSLLRLLAVALMFTYFFTNHYTHTRNKASTVEFERRIARQTDRICKSTGKCPETIEGFVCSRSGDCTLEQNGYTIHYRVSGEESEQTFLLGGKLDGYEAFHIEGGVDKPLNEGHSHTS